MHMKFGRYISEEVVHSGQLFQRKHRSVCYMENHKLQPLTEHEKQQAEEHHGLVYSFLHRHGYELEKFYDVVIFGYLKAIQVYNRREDLQKNYQLAFICEQYMRSEIGNYFRTETAQKRKPTENIISLDADYAETENFYNCVGGKSAEVVLMESESIGYILENLSEIQRKITVMKVKGYGNKEIYLILKIKPSTYYRELQHIKAVLEKLVS